MTVEDAIKELSCYPKDFKVVVNCEAQSLADSKAVAIMGEKSRKVVRIIFDED